MVGEGRRRKVGYVPGFQELRRPAGVHAEPKFGYVPGFHMRAFLTVTAWVHGFIAVLLALAALLLLATAIHTGWTAVMQGMRDEDALTVIEAIGLVAVAIVS